MGNKSGTPVLRQEDIDVLITTSGMDETQVIIIDLNKHKLTKHNISKSQSKEKLKRIKFLNNCFLPA